MPACCGCVCAWWCSNCADPQASCKFYLEAQGEQFGLCESEGHRLQPEDGWAHEALGHMASFLHKLPRDLVDVVVGEAKKVEDVFGFIGSLCLDDKQCGERIENGPDSDYYCKPLLPDFPMGTCRKGTRPADQKKPVTVDDLELPGNIIVLPKLPIDDDDPLDYLDGGKDIVDGVVDDVTDKNVTDTIDLPDDKDDGNGGGGGGGGIVVLDKVRETSVCGQECIRFLPPSLPLSV